MHLRSSHFLRALVAAALTLSVLLPGAAAQEGSGEVSFMVFGDPAELAAYQDLVAAFEDEHPSPFGHDEAVYPQRLLRSAEDGPHVQVRIQLYHRCGG